MSRLKLALRNIIAVLLTVILLQRSVPPPPDRYEQVRALAANILFDYSTWLIDALELKGVQSALALPRYLPEASQKDTVKQYFDLVGQIEAADSDIARIYADPAVTAPAEAAADLLARRDALAARRNRLAPLAESIIQQQINAVTADMGLSLGGQNIPPTLYHVTPLPLALIVSPRDTIRTDVNLSLQADLNLEQITRLEQKIEQTMDVSALVVPVGGVGVYPTMVESSSDLSWTLSTVAHEWIHNYLTLRPLGMSYEKTPQLRTMNETSANLSGKEIGQAALARFYPELLPPPPAPASTATPTTVPQPSAPPVFDPNRELHITRVQVDAYLKAGKIVEAEQYMETRRRFLWDNGYRIRRLNQAYFAFNGAYADTPGTGAAGEDPVGPAVVQLRQQSPSLADFLNRIAWMTSFDELQQAVAGRR